MDRKEIELYATRITNINQVTILTFKDGSKMYGYFESDNDNPADRDKNTWSFTVFVDTENKGRRIHIIGDDLLSIEIVGK